MATFRSSDPLGARGTPERRRSALRSVHASCSPPSIWLWRAGHRARASVPRARWPRGVVAGGTALIRSGPGRHARDLRPGCRDRGRGRGAPASSGAPVRRQRLRRAALGSRTSTRMISSVAYADDEMLSTTAGPVKMLSRSRGSSDVASGRPMRTPLRRCSAIPSGLVGAPVPARGTRWPRPTRVNPRCVAMRTKRCQASCP
jgi:hypothetical protein